MAVNGYRDWLLGLVGAAALAAVGNGLLMWRDVGAQEVKITELEKKTESVPADIATMKECISNIKENVAEIKASQGEILREIRRANGSD